MNLESSAIKSVSFYIATGPVECCDRCSAGIRNVFAVSYRDGEIQKYGSECINKILGAEPTLRKLFNKNIKLLKLYKDYLAIFSGPINQMPRGREYFNSGLYFIGDSHGEDIFFNGHWFFHPLFDQDKNAIGPHYIVNDSPEEYANKQLAEYERRDKAKLVSEIARLEAFLAKILRAVKKEAA
jgi:hypothetical protein